MSGPVDDGSGRNQAGPGKVTGGHPFDNSCCIVCGVRHGDPGARLRLWIHRNGAVGLEAYVNRLNGQISARQGTTLRSSAHE
jgi:hypothetical protein